MSDLADNAIDAARQENVARILEAAERLFRHYGYAKTNVADIARELDMSPANIYRFLRRRRKSTKHFACACSARATSRRWKSRICHSVLPSG